MYYYIYDTDMGYICISERRGAISHIQFQSEPPAEPAEPMEYRETWLIERAAVELMQYFMGRREQFSLPLAPAGTAFQKNIWRIMRQIPYGSTVSIRVLAREAGVSQDWEAVNQARRKNPISILIPEHRITGAGREVQLPAAKRRVRESLLALEYRVYRSQRQPVRESYRV